MTRADRIAPADARPTGGHPPVGRPARGVHDGKELRGVLGRFATGITVVTAGAATPHGMTANSFTSVSMDPPLVLVCVRRDATMHDVISDGGVFAVSVLSGRQEPLARYFANRTRPKGEHEFDVVDHQPGPCTGVPVMSDTLAWLECELTAVYDGGDHSIFVGLVVAMGRGAGSDALLFFGGEFHGFDAAG
jgi:flavin reductase (DIM6/NTAB) family NADH-FMN oxidoreductase RutF